LDYSQLSGSNKLILVHIEHLDFNSSNLEQHFFPQVINLHNLILFDLLDLLLVVFPLVISLFDPHVPLFSFFKSCALVLQEVIVDLSLLLNLLVERMEDGNVNFDDLFLLLRYRINQLNLPKAFCISIRLSLAWINSSLFSVLSSFVALMLFELVLMLPDLIYF
jgi:hypothetical protein